MRMTLLALAIAGALPIATSAAPVQLAPGSATKITAFDKLESATGTIKPFGEPPKNTGSNPAFTASACSSTAVLWSVSGVNCSGQAPDSPNNATTLVSSTSNNVGQAQFTCTNGTFTQAPGPSSCQLPATPPPPSSPPPSAPPPASPPPAPTPSGCPAGTRSWQTTVPGFLGLGSTTHTCQSNGPAMPHAGSQSVTDNTAPGTGTATFTCNNGSITQSSGSCGDTPPPPSPPPSSASCSAGTRSWTVNGNACSAPGTSLSNGQTQLLTDSTTPVIGSATVSCNNGTISYSQSPPPVCVKAASYINAGGQCLILQNTDSMCWGQAPLGNGTTDSSNVPVRTSTPQNSTSFETIAHTTRCRLSGSSTSKTLRCWGWDGRGQTGTGFSTNRIGGGTGGRDPHTVYSPTSVLSGNINHLTSEQRKYFFVIHNGALKYWGDVCYISPSSCNNGTTATPTTIPGFGSGVTLYGRGGFFVHNNQLKKIINLGDGISTANVTGQSGTISQISGSCFIESSGALKCAGAEQFQFNPRSHTVGTPRVVQGMTSGVTKVENNCAIQNGAVKCWDHSSTINGAAGPISPVYQMAGLTSGVSDISGDLSYGCAIHNGAAKCWGNGPLGDGTNSPNSSPQQVIGLTSGVTQISVFTDRACAIHHGIAKCWGKAPLGDGTTNDSSTPVTVQH